MSRGGVKRPPVVLLVDDDSADQELTRRAFGRAEISGDLRGVDDGEGALEYLNRRGRYADADRSPRPDLVILDLNMPGLDGYRVLEEIRGDAHLRRLPVVVMSTTTNVDDVNRTYALGCNTFIRKPTGFDELVHVVSELVPYWFRLVQLPGSSS
jgi:CheY-like chemotaxis protein